MDVFDKSKVEKIELGEETDDLDLREWPVVHLSGGKTLAARLLVGADGANSPVRSFAGIESRGWDYGRHGVVATLELEGDGWGGEYNKIAISAVLTDWSGRNASHARESRHAGLVDDTRECSFVEKAFRQGLHRNGQRRVPRERRRPCLHAHSACRPGGGACVEGSAQIH